MKRLLPGAPCAVLAAVSSSAAFADVWILRDGTLERLDVDGADVATVSAPCGTPIGALLRAGDVDPRTGNIRIVAREPTSQTPRVVRVLGLGPSGEELRERAVTGVGFAGPSIAVDTERRGVWVGGGESVPAVLYDETMGDARATVRPVEVRRSRGTERSG